MSAARTEDEIGTEAKSRLGGVGQRFTSSRRSLVEILSRSDRPLTMPELLAEGPGLAQSSVYRNLTVLEEAGVVRRIVTHDEFARFELAEDLTGHHHHHLVCTVCGGVQDCIVPAAIEELLDSALIELAGAHGFAVEAHRLDLLGRCATCRTA